MAKKGGLTSKFYRETRGVKVTGGEFVRAGTILTREGSKWKPGLNVTGQMHLNAACDGTVYFSRKRNKYKKSVTYVNVNPMTAPANESEKS
ncbi:MAG TPA: 50S ribosomal protein L27 [Candidatus Omnitrophota bacterium]|nr:50S ribosomal protein L27 [Candidatus Omnitrophota bacterium]HPB68257.1 50S ribosomal protein L27 [Candidatus Omnitrophota bacterium]HQO57711.1 50S ribosomal protein L27 [Candidatus Omnitrophota bacterium]HQP12820.1 50S ribosomal protein L27 [Candidatus Omnitrophota bacterium]